MALTVTFIIFTLLNIILISLYVVAIKTSNTTQILKKYNEYLSNESKKKLKDEILRLNEKKNEVLRKKIQKLRKEETTNEN